MGAGSFSASAQTPLSNLVFAVGTTIRDASNQEWSYVLLDSVDGATLAGRRFGVFGKPGNATSPNPFTQRGTLAPQSDLATINGILNQSIALGDDLNSLNDAFAKVINTNLVGLLRKVPGITSQSLAQRVVTARQLAVTDPELAEALALVGKGHPGMNRCLGRAFAEQINSVTTYELRELDPGSGTPGDVVGRVTVIPGAPVVLPAPGRPFQVVTNDPTDHLRIRLRWGAPPALRQLSLLQSGYTVWRMSRAAAETAGFHLNTPTLAQLTGNAGVARANAAPVVAPAELDLGSGFGAAEYAADRLTYFFADTGRATGPTFTDGQEFYYFATARDILGRDGLVSPGGLARACRRLAPKSATDLRVENAVLPGSTNLPRLQVIWKQNPNATDAVSEYWVYRWINPTAALTNDASPLSHRIAVVPQLAATNLNSYLDTATGALTNANLSNVWYTVRAVSVAACDPLLSPHTAPAWGVLRQRDGPVATTGELIGSCGTPVVMFQNFTTNPSATLTQRWSFTLSCTRRDPGIAWVQYTITDVNSYQQTNVTTVGPIYFPPDGDVVRFEHFVAQDLVLLHTQRVACVVGTGGDQVAAAAVCVLPAAPGGSLPREAAFFAGQLLGTALSASDPLLPALNNGVSQCLPGNSVTPDASGMVSMTFDYNDAPTVLVQALSNTVWLDLAVVTPTTNRIYWVSYPACLIGPVPAFRGCRVTFPAGNGDCEQHVSAAADGGAIAPIRVRFRLTPRTREYRVYRRVDDGPLTLFAQGAAFYDPANPGKLIESKDEAMPPSAARLCYFVQLLDEHGNGSPLAFIGCKSSKPPKMPRPMLGEPQAAGTINSPQVALNWFCPTSGVSRFQFKITYVDSDTPTPPAGGFLSTQLSSYSGYNKSLSFLGLKNNVLQLVSFLEAHFTPYVGPGFGPGPQFTITANIRPNTTYDIGVTPVDEQGGVHHEATSEVFRFKWTPPTMLATVPWPARPLPPVRNFDDVPPPASFTPRIGAILMTDANFALDTRYPVGVTIGDFSRMPPGDTSAVYPNVRTTNFFQYRLTVAPAIDPNEIFVFRRASNDPLRHGQSLLPIVLYRQQVTNAMFARVSGDVTQVSPLIERIPFISNNNVLPTIPDRLIGSSYFSANGATYTTFCLRDQQPVIQGARYRYFVLRFNRQHEPEEIIPAGEVEIPIAPNGP